MSDKELKKSTDNEQHSYLDAFRNLEHKIEHMFSRMWHNPFHHNEESTTSFPLTLQGIPKMDIIDRDKELVVKAELPGIDKKDLDVSITNNRLFIRAKTCHEEKEEKGDYLRQETTRSEFYRSMLLPANVDDSNIKSTFKNGLLELVIPKTEDSHRKHIEIE